MSDGYVCFHCQQHHAGNPNVVMEGNMRDRTHKELELCRPCWVESA